MRSGKRSLIINIEATAVIQIFLLFLVCLGYSDYERIDFLSLFYKVLREEQTALYWIKFMATIINFQIILNQK